MTRPAFREVAKRAWDIGPSWTDAAGLVVAGVLLVWWWGIPWQVAVLLPPLACAVIFGTLGWLDLCNEAADAAEQDDGLSREGEDI